MIREQRQVRPVTGIRALLPCIGKGLFYFALVLSVGLPVWRHFPASAQQPTDKGVLEDKVVDNKLLFLPEPQHIEIRNVTHRLRADCFILLEGETPASVRRVGLIAQEALAKVGERWELTAYRGEDASRIGCLLEIDAELVSQPEGYHLTIDETRIRIVGHDEAGLFYGAMTLKQIASQAGGKGQLPCLSIEDHPDFPHRGIVRDISRDKVPTLDSLYAIVDLMAEWKMNELQLYMEHTFAYRDHQEVWEKASPLTGEDILALDAYCRERHVTLVPNQNSFAHMGRWLEHAAYRGLAEVPEAPGTLCPVDPNSIRFLAGLYDELLPHFSSPWANVGCDETWDLGTGRSKAAADERGVGRVYLEFLSKINDLVRERGKTMQFWGDIILNHPELIPELPEGAIALAWGYEAEHPYADQCAKFAAAGVPFYVCPGTSAWNTIVGRTENAVGNLLNAAENGLASGASGYLVTDWGDGGHWQQLPISYLGYAYGAALSWAVNPNRVADLPRLLDRYAFQDRAGVLGQMAYDLGNVYLETGVLTGNSNVFGQLLANPNLSMEAVPWNALEVAGLERAIGSLDELEVRLEEADSALPDAEVVVGEFRNGIALARHASHLCAARLAAGRVEVPQLPAEARAELAAELEPILTEFRRLWLLRNRPGGLEDSVGRFERLLASYKR